MHIIPGAILTLVGAAAVAYIARGASAFEQEPPLGNDLACQQIATRLIESAERSPSAPPTAWEARAALVLDTELCPAASEPGPCGARRYAVGTVALRAGRLDAAKAAFRQACDFERGWCARAAQEQAVPWTPDELQRLERRARP